PPGRAAVRGGWALSFAACVRACGPPRQRWHADRWFRADRTPPDVLAPFHLDVSCQGVEKVRNGLFTLQKLVGQSFCLAFDQLEDTYLTLAQPGATEATRFSALVGILVRNLLTMPGFCLLFACQEPVWQNCKTLAPPMLVQRMTEGAGELTLQPLNDATAQELVRQRMDVAVFQQFVDAGLPPNEPCFPFTADEVRQMRLDAHSD